MPNLKQRLKGKIGKSRLDKLRNAFDVVGDVAILEIPEELKAKGRVIAAGVMETHGNVRAVYAEKSARSGKYRLQKLQWLAGEKRTETVAAENGVRLKLDVAKVYFSPRQATERKRICGQVRSGENVLVMFSGAGPYAVEIAKHCRPKMVFGIEANRAAHGYAEENAAANGVESAARFHCGDVRRVMPALRKKFDRIIMPLPKGARDYLPLAFRYVRKRGTIHYYDFLPAEGLDRAAREIVSSAAKKSEKKIKIRRVVKCGQLAPRAYRVCVDVGIV